MFLKIFFLVWYLLVFAVVTGLVLWGLILLTPSKPSTVGYDCQLAEISPDIPLAYKQACREAKRIRP